MMTFDELCKTENPQQKRVADLQRTFLPTVETLRTLRKTIQKSQPTWEQRWAAIEARRQKAARDGAVHTDLEVIAHSLCGDGCLQGSLATILPQIDETIQRLSHLSEAVLDYPQTWKPWYNEPQNFRANIGSIEEQLTKAERLVRDGGELLQKWEELKMKRLPQDMAPAMPAETGSGHPARVVVET